MREALCIRFLLLFPPLAIIVSAEDEGAKPPLLADAPDNIPLFMLRFATVYTVDVFLIGLGHLSNDKSFDIVTIIHNNAIAFELNFHPSTSMAAPVCSSLC